MTPWTAARQASLSITNSQSLPKLMSIESMMPSNYPILCRPLLLPPSFFPTIRVFSNESVLQIRGPKYWRFSFSIYRWGKLRLTDIKYLAQKHMVSSVDWIRTRYTCDNKAHVWHHGWHHRFEGLEFEHAPGVGDGQGGLACCSPWGREELNATDRLNWNE